MPTFQRCDDTVNVMAQRLIQSLPIHKPLLDCKVTVDFVFAYSDKDVGGNPTNDALTKNGVKCLGLTRKIALKDRALGRADAEIALDGDWWQDANDNERAALLDHELTHIAVKLDKTGAPCTDDLHRPILQLRPHDYEIGWFKAVAVRHGMASQERKQAKAMMDDSGQYFWPLAQAVTEGSRISNLEIHR